MFFFNVKMVKTNTLGNIRIKFTVHNDIALVMSDFLLYTFKSATVGQSLLLMKFVIAEICLKTCITDYLWKKTFENSF